MDMAINSTGYCVIYVSMPFAVFMSSYYKYVFAIIVVGVCVVLTVNGMIQTPEHTVPVDSTVLQVGTEPAEKDAGVEFCTDYATARENAKKENKPILMFFYGPNCTFSQQMRSVTFNNKDIKRLAEQFICVQVDEGSNLKLCTEFEVKGTPTIQFMTPQGTLLQRLTASQTSDHLLMQMQVVIQSLASSEKRINAGSRL